MKTDDDLGRDLRAATGRDLPDEDAFAERVMHEIEGGGGVRTISAELPRPRPLLKVAAAAAIAGLLLGALAGGRLFRPGADGPALAAAAAGDMDLPAAETGEALPGPLEIRLRAGEEPDWEALAARVRAAVGADEPIWDSTYRIHRMSLQDVLLLADRDVPWRHVQWALQTCADPTVGLSRIYWGVEGGKSIPVFLPSDRGLRGSPRVIEDPVDEGEEKPEPSDRPFESPSIGVMLRVSEQGAIEITYAGRDLDGSFRNLEAALAFAPPKTLEIDASANVPYGDVVRAVDLARKAGCRDFTLRGAPPPPKK